MRTQFDIGEIIRCHGGEFLSKHHVVPAVERAFRHMAQCRTSALGGHYHPHIHCIVPGGGVDKRDVWHHLKGCKRSDFLFPVRAMSDKFYGRFMSLITRRLKEKKVIINQDIRRQCKETPWVVYSRPPAKGVGQVLEYIGRYAYRVAITRSALPLGSSKNSRILNVTDDSISYDYKDYRSGGKHKVKTDSIDTFLNHLSQHILPSRFVRIRHYGILSPCNREILRSIQRQLRSTLSLATNGTQERAACTESNEEKVIS